MLLGTLNMHFTSQLWANTIERCIFQVKNRHVHVNDAFLQSVCWLRQPNDAFFFVNNGLKQTNDALMQANDALIHLNDAFI